MRIKFKNSIRMKLSVLLLCITSGTFILYVLINQFFLEDYYISNKKENLLQAYEDVEELLSNKTYISSDLENDILKICERTGASLIVADNADNIGYQFGNTKKLIVRLCDITLGKGENTTIIKSNNKYTFQKYLDITDNDEYFEIWGSLNSKYLFLLQMPIENIHESVYLTRTFFLYVGTTISIISILIAFILSGRFSKPILKLANISEKMSNMDFSLKYDVNSTDEIGMLGNSINKLSNKLENNILELKRANNELKRDNDKKQEIDEMRKDFISNVSHELKTPIALIQGYAEGLQECINDDAESREFYCEVIMDEADKMNKMVRSLLTLNQLEFGKYQVQFEKFNINLVINGVLNSLNYLTNQQGIQVKYDSEEENIVFADEFQVEGVITNYLTNAIHYANGEKILRINIKKKEKTTRISVFNSGDNIPNSELENIWVKFYKVDKARTREYGGSGIGLSVVKAVMDAHGQEYGVINHNDGVEFYFDLDSDFS